MHTPAPSMKLARSEYRNTTSEAISYDRPSRLSTIPERS